MTAINPAPGSMEGWKKTPFIFPQSSTQSAPSPSSPFQPNLPLDCRILRARTLCSRPFFKPFSKADAPARLCFSSTSLLFFFSYHCSCNTLLGEGAKSTAEDGLTVRLREAQVFGNRLLWNKFQDNPPVMLILCLRVLVECFGCVHRQSRKSTFSQGSAGVYLRLA